MSLLSSFILGCVEGITEFLPISSTGHLILTARLIGITQTNFLKSFEIAIQLGAILSVIVLYWKLLVTDLDMLKRLAVAFIPTAVIGLVFYKVVKYYLLGNSSVVLWALFLGGIFILVFEWFYQKKNMAPEGAESISYKQALLIGLFQSFALVPGVSRSAATIIGGLMLGLKRRTIVEFSFLLAVPTMACATALDLSKNAFSFSSSELIYLSVGFITSFITALLAIKFLLAFIRKNNFVSFGIYRIALALLLWKII